MCICHPIFTEKDILDLWFSTVGIEREAIRLNKDLSFSQTPHSNEWGSRDFHPYIQTDFAENQIEVITPPFDNSADLFNFLKAIHQIVNAEIANNNEILWSYSTPPFIPEIDKIKVAQLTDTNEKNYRKYLLDVYGHQVQLLSGIHYNFQINPSIMKQKTDNSDNPIKTKNEIYSMLGRNYLRYHWLLTYLLGASPFVPNDYETKLYGKPNNLPMRSVRQSRYGYKNESSVQVRYDSFENFVTDLESLVHSKKLTLEKELYSDVRFRSAKPTRKLLEQGINYIEFRNFDLNPFATYGINKEDLDFIKVFIISMLLIPDVKSNEEVLKGQSLNRETAEASPLASPIDLQEAEWLFNEMINIANILDKELNTNLSKQVNQKHTMLLRPELTLAGQIYSEFKSQEEINFHGQSLSIQHQSKILEKPYLLHGFENFEISTQDLIKEAIRLGLKVSIIDEQDNLIKLTYNNHEEIIRKANMTQYDTQIAYFIMENKVATKVLLNTAGITTPHSITFTDRLLAKNYYSHLSKNKFVIKPKSTNYGLGISIFTHMPTKEDYEAAINVAFDADHTIMIENFAEGSEYRFYVQGDEVLAITERVAAHVIADGVHTVGELIDIENTHPLRGPQHMTPLTNIGKGETERIQLASQDLTFESIPEKDQVVYLRSNSNVSTGGLPIDQTYNVDSTYKTIAIEATKALGATICGVDLLIQDKDQPATKDNYAIIEANFNPAMMIHRFPGKGEPRYLAFELIKFIFPELPIN